MDLKTADVTGILNKRSKSEPGNYRPVRLACVACKVLESFVRDAIVTHLTENRLYAECQHGFRKKEVIRNPTFRSDGRLFTMVG